MNFSAVSNRNIFGKIVRLPLKLIPKETPLPVLQGRLKGKKWIAGSSVHGCWLGSYELQKRLLFEQVVRPGSIIFDIGANVGFYTLLASILVGSDGHVFAFEPLPANIHYLRKHVSINNISNTTIINAAVSDRCGVASFTEDASRCKGHISPEGNLQVETIQLDNWIANKKLPDPDYLKIDVEGAELEVLTGARECIARARPAIFLATHGAKVHKDCCQLLQTLDYQLRPLDSKEIATTREVFAVKPSLKSLKL